MALSNFAAIGVDIAAVVGVIFIVFFMQFIIGLLANFIKTYKTNCKLEREMCPQHNSTTTHRSQSINPELCEQPNRTHLVAGVSILAYTYHESKHNENIGCVVCLCLLQEGETVLQLPACGHLLHYICICSWFAANSICPGCGTPVNARFTVQIGGV